VTLLRLVVRLHPESIMTEQGLGMLRSFMASYAL